MPRPRPGSAERPLRIVVIGSSVVFMTIPRSDDKDHGVYGTLLPELLSAQGVPTVAWVHAQWHATVREVLPKWEGWVRDHFPDIIIINVGMADAQPRVLPTWFTRNTNTWLPGMSAPAALYRRRLAPQVRDSSRELQRWLIPKVGQHSSRVPPERFRRSMHKLITMGTRDLGAQVLVLDIDPPGDKLLHFLPGLDQRVRSYNSLLESLTADNPRAHLVRTSNAVKGDRFAELLPDGLHRSAEGHQRVAEILATKVLELRSSWDPQVPAQP